MSEGGSKPVPFWPWMAKLVGIHVVFCGLAWLYLIVVPWSIGLTLKLVLMFALAAAGLCGWLWYRDRRAALRRIADASRPDPSVE